MRAKLDENMPNEAIELLLGAGWVCDTVRDEGLGPCAQPGSRPKPRQGSDPPLKPTPGGHAMVSLGGAA